LTNHLLKSPFFFLRERERERERETAVPGKKEKEMRAKQFSSGQSLIFNALVVPKNMNMQPGDESG